jgi:hypothetical protein
MPTHLSRVPAVLTRRGLHRPAWLDRPTGQLIHRVAFAGVV